MNNAATANEVTLPNGHTLRASSVLGTADAILAMLDAGCRPDTIGTEMIRVFVEDARAYIGAIRAGNGKRGAR